MIDLKPLDIVVVDGLWYIPHHWMIRWRGLDAGVHCLTVISEDGTVISPEFTGMVSRNVSHYRGRNITVHRYCGPVKATPTDFKSWLMSTVAKSKGYDFRQWVMGFILGLTRKKWVDDSDHWTCAELPYWMFEENEYSLGPKQEVLPMPRFFRYNPLFEIVYEGKV